jgi:hypothetical protein
MPKSALGRRGDSFTGSGSGWASGQVAVSVGAAGAGLCGRAVPASIAGLAGIAGTPAVLRARLEHKVEGRLCSAAEAAEATCGDDVPDSCFACLCAQRERNLLGQ